MLPRSNERRLLWLGLGLAAGLCLAYVWPHEFVQASATDRIDEKFAICTVETQLVNLAAQPDAVFVLDSLTGRLSGAMINQQSFTFTNFWFRNISADFNMQKNAAAKAKYTIIPGNAYLTSGGGETLSTGCLYVGELTSGKVICYTFTIRLSKVPLPVVGLEPVTFFSFKDQVAAP